VWADLKDRRILDEVPSRDDTQADRNRLREFDFAGQVYGVAGPLEKWWCDALLGRPSALAGMKAYALCWTSSRYDEPAWRMVGFGKQYPIVRIRTRASDLLQAAEDFVSKHRGAMFLGAVKYSGEGSLKAAAARMRNGQMKDVTRTAATMLLHKRRAFRFEKEIRLLWLDTGKSQSRLPFPFPARKAITQVMISPYVNALECAQIIRELKPYGVKTVRSGVLNAPRDLSSKSMTRSPGT
jgi:hypothetical protein